MITDKASLWAAARRFEGILRSDPGAYSFAPLSDIYRQLGLLDEALETARGGSVRHPGFSAGQMALARAAMESGLKGEAITALESVVRITPENIEAQRLLADLYAAMGNGTGAARCISIADSLEISFREVSSVSVAAVDDEPLEELLDADILELSDEYIDDEDLDDSPAHFSASPERPSLGGHGDRPEPFLLESPPPLYEEEPQPQEPPVVMASATIAELYVNQGFPEKGAEVYRELLQAEPANTAYEKRLAELTRPAETSAAESLAPEEAGFMDKLQEWLGNIGRVRVCRSKSL